MNQYSGSIFSGELDQSNNSFYLTEVKSIQTGSVLSVNQLTQLYDYLTKQRDNCMLTVNDQMPVLIQKQEKDKLLNDISHIVKSLNELKIEGSTKDV